MKTLLTLLLLAPASACFAQTYVVEKPAKLGDEKIPAYRTLADTAGKPFTNMFPHSNVSVVGRQGARWTVITKGNTEYIVRTSQLPADVQQVAMTATPLKAISFDQATGKVIYSEVVQVPGASQAELYARAKLWFANTFRSAKDVVQAEDKEAGVIQGTGFQDIYLVAMGMPIKEKLWYTVKLALKDGRYKYDITDLGIQSYPNQYNLSPGQPTPIEGYIATEQKKGTALSIANSARREVTTVGTVLSASIVTGMGKSAAGTASGKDW